MREHVRCAPRVNACARALRCRGGAPSMPPCPWPRCRLSRSSRSSCASCRSVSRSLHEHTTQATHAIGQRGHAFEASPKTQFILHSASVSPLALVARRALGPREAAQQRKQAGRIPAAAATRRRCVAPLPPLSHAAPRRAGTAMATTPATARGARPSPMDVPLFADCCLDSAKNQKDQK